MPVQGRHPSQYAWRPRRPPDTVPDLGRFAGVHATGVKPAGAGGEPGALTAHARFWEGPGVNWTRIKYCDTTRGNGWTTGKTNRILNPRDPGLLTHSGRYGPGKWLADDRPRGHPCRSAAKTHAIRLAFGNAYHQTRIGARCPRRVDCRLSAILQLMDSFDSEFSANPAGSDSTELPQFTSTHNTEMSSRIPTVRADVCTEAVGPC